MKKSNIVRILAASSLLTLGVAATSFAAMGDKEVDVNIGLATESYSGSGTGFAMSVGGGYELLKIPAIKGSTLQVRGDLGYNRWSDSPYGTEVTITRIPLSGGARLYIPIEKVKNLRVYGEADLEISFDSVEVAIPTVVYSGTTTGGGKVTQDDTKVGLLLGGGVEYAFTPNIFVTGALKFHAIDNGFVNILGGIGYKF